MDISIMKKENMVIDAQGNYLIPGLVDIHLDQPEGSRL